MIHKIAVCGLGRVGRLVALLLAEQGFEVVGLDQGKPEGFPLPFKSISIFPGSEFDQILAEVDTVVSCLPYHLTLTVAEAAQRQGLHYFDLTEDRQATEQILQWSRDARGVMVPQCGLAPGFICIVGQHLAQRHPILESLELRVGALAAAPKGTFRYTLTWSPEGVVNEYLNPCEVLADGILTQVEARSGLETLAVNGHSFEAAATSGGLGTLCKHLANKVRNLNYKSIRFAGHFNRIEWLFDNPFLKPFRPLLGAGLKFFSGPDTEDQVVVKGTATTPEGTQESFAQIYLPKTLVGERWPAICWTTACSLVAMIELVHSQKLPQRGFIAQESTSLELFLQTKAGSNFK